MEDIFDVLCVSGRQLVKDVIVSSIEQEHIVPLISYMLLRSRENARRIIKMVKKKKKEIESNIFI